MSSALDVYKRELKEASRRLSPEEERELVALGKGGDRAARDKIITSCLLWVMRMANIFKGLQHLEYADYVLEGNLALIEAFDKFNPNRGVRFLSYARWVVLTKMSRLSNSQSRVFSVPDSAMKDLRNIRKVEHDLAQSLGRDPTIEEIADLCTFGEWPMTAKRVGLVVESSETRSVGRDVMALGEDYICSLPDVDGKSPDTEVSKKEAVGEARNFLNCLDPREKFVTILSWGLDGRPILPYVTIGRMIGVSRERVRQIRDQAMEKMHERAGVLDRDR